MYMFDVEGTIYNDWCAHVGFLPYHLITMKFVQEQFYEI